MRTIALTPWFQRGTKPARPGVYQGRDGANRYGYQKWDGTLWYGLETSPERAEENAWAVPSRFQSDPWRGLMIVED